ncbi:MAG: SurA N-terminal domain-containing protein [Victivallaceae bacterium]|nr:SurA N-terminal domain-containing protein [Victivallaceae bacterium]
MVIRKINSVFTRHGRIIFGLFTLIIIISFMGFMQPGSGFLGFGGLFNFGKKYSYGEIFGEAVSRNEIIRKADRDLIISDVIYNTGLNSHPAASRAEANAFYNLCLLAAAKRRGITASDKEITDFIVARPKFRNPETKVFDRKFYTGYINNELSANGFSAADLDAAVREYLIRSKLLDELQESIIVTPNEITEFYRLLNEKYYVSYVLFDMESYLKQVKVTSKEAENYFTAGTPSPEDYIPGKSRVLLVAFRYDHPEIRKRAEQQLTPEAVKDFYEKNKNLFMKFKQGQKAQVIPYAEAEAEAGKRLARRYAEKFASEKAGAFMDAAYDAVGEAAVKKQRKIFEDVLRQFKYKGVMTDWFRDDAEKIGGLEEKALIREISALREVPVSNAVPGKDAVYVAFVTDRIAPRPALFEEIKDKIMVKLKKQQALKLARCQARELAAKLQKMDKTARLKSVADSKVPRFELVKPFSLLSPPRVPYGNVIAGLSRELKNGEVAPAQNIATGAIVLVLRKRVLPAKSGFDEKQREMLTNIYRKQKIAVTESVFLAWLQTKCRQNEPQ